MAYIEMIAEGDAEGELAAQYKRGGNPDGTVDEVLKVHSLNPGALRAHLEVYIESMHRPSPLSRAEREIVGTVVSRANGCGYCVAHHAAGLRRLVEAERPGLAEAVASGASAELTDRERAMVDYALKLTTTPGEVTESDVEALRAVGLEDRSVHDLANVVAYFCFANRIVLGLGAQIEGHHAIGQWPGS